MSRRLPVALSISLTLVAMMSLSLHAPRPLSAATPGIYVALGDSIAAGVGSSLPRSRGNAAIVAEWLARLTGETVPHENLAVPGETAVTFIDAGQLERFRDTVARSAAAGVPIAAVTLSLGGNELLALDASGLSDRQAGLDEFSIRYADALQAVRAEIGPETPLVVTTYYDLTAGDETIQFSDAWWIEQFNSVIRRVAEEQGALVADLAGQFAGRIGDFTHYPFDVHPTNLGHLAIARAIWATLGLDDRPPSIDATTNIEAIRSTPTIRFSVDDNVGVSSVTAYGDNVSVSGPFETGDNEYVTLLDLQASDREEVALTIEIGDDAGNVTRQVVTVWSAVGNRGESQ